MVRHSLYLSKCMLIPIEAQGEEFYKYTLPFRSLYYAYRLIANQKIILPGVQKSLYNDNIAVRSFWICLHHPKIKNNCLLEYVTLEIKRWVAFVLILNLVESLRLIFYIRPFNQKKTRKQLKICVHLARVLILPG